MKKASKVLFVGLNSDDAINGLPPGDYTHANNLTTANGGVSNNPLRENVVGTLLRANDDLPTGDNTCIGSFEDRQSNRLIYFLYNSDGNHSIWYFNPETNTHTLILQSEYLQFDINRKITGIGVIGDILSFTDGGTNIKCLNIQKASDGYYDTGEALTQQISLHRVSPMIPPTAVKATNSSIAVNNISSDGWQFAFRYVYHDNEFSLFSPMSKLVLPNVYPTNTDTENYVVVTATIQEDVRYIIKKVQFAFVKNNFGEYRVFKETTANGSSSYVANFYNSESALTVPVNESINLNSTPNTTNNLTLFKERTFVTLDSYDYQSVGNFTLTLTELATNSSVSQIHLPGSSYTYGVLCFDEFGRTNGVLSPTTISFGQVTAQNNTTVDQVSDLNKNVTWSLGGTPPTWAKYFSLCRKLNNTIASSCVIPVQVMFYKRDDADGSDRGVDEVADNGQIFHEDHQNSWTENLYLRLPDNMPISIDTTYKIRLLQSIGQSRSVENVLALKGGNKLICGNFGITNWTGKSLIFLVRLEAYRTEPTEAFYEIGQTYTITDGAFDTTTGSAYGDYYRITQSNLGQAFQFNKINAGDLYSSTSADQLTNDKYWQATVYSQSPTTASVAIDTVEVSVEREKPKKGALLKKLAGAALTVAGTAFGGPAGGAAGGAIGGIIEGDKGPEGPKSTTTSEVKRVFTFDYNKIISDNGRPFVEINNKIVSEEPTTIAFSERFIPNSKVNGLNMFIDGNVYPVSPVRTPIRKLQPSGDVVLAIHEKAATSLYIGQSFITSGDGTDQIGKTTAVIGDDRHLGGGFGTLHPESVVEHDSKVYWFDAYSGEAIRYNNGITPIGSVYKMKKYFREKGDRVVNGFGNVFGGYDPYLDIAYFTFIGSAEIIQDGITGSFDESGFENPTFVSTLSPWLQLDPGTSGPSWNHSSVSLDGNGAAAVTTTGTSDILYQNIPASGSITITGLLSMSASSTFQLVFLNGTTIIGTENIITTTFSGAIASPNYTTTAPVGTTGVGVRYITTEIVSPGISLSNLYISTTSSVSMPFDNSDLVVGDDLRIKLLYDSGNIGDEEEFTITVNSIVVYSGTIVSGVEKLIDFEYTGGSTIDAVKVSSSTGTITATILRLNSDSETIGFVDRPGYERWISFYDFKPEYYGKINSRFFSFKDGQLWEHNAGDTANNFYGEQYESEVTTIFNAEYNKEKILRNIGIESNEPWDFSCETPGGQQTDLAASKLVRRDHVYYGDVLRDRNTNPALLKPGQIAIKSGKEMSDKAFEVTLTNDSTDLVKLDAITIGYVESPGHRVV